MLLPMLYYLADVIAFLNVVVVSMTLHHRYGFIMADVIATVYLCDVRSCTKLARCQNYS